MEDFDVTPVDWQDVDQALTSLRTVEGGFTPARRGLVTLPGGRSVFIKMATGEYTTKWINREREVYRWLAVRRFAFAPPLLAERDGAIVLPDMSHLDWKSQWTQAKVTAVHEAIDAVAELRPGAGDMFSEADYGSNFWPSVPYSLEAYHWAEAVLSPRYLNEVAKLLADQAVREEYSRLSATDPWRGEELTHGDVRSDNFAFNEAMGKGYLVDWNWTMLSRRVFDHAALWTDIYQTGYPVTAAQAATFDRPSLAYLAGFWLVNAMQQPEDDREIRLRRHQLESAMAAHALCQLAAQL